MRPFVSPTFGSYRFRAEELEGPGPAEFLACLRGFASPDFQSRQVAAALLLFQNHDVVGIETR